MLVHYLVMQLNDYFISLKKWSLSCINQITVNAVTQLTGSTQEAFV